MRLLLAVPILLLSCGPIVGGVHLVKADVAVAAAWTAGAKQLAPYEIAIAEMYLHKAREENGYADHFAAQDFATKAIEFAVRAKKIAVAVAGADTNAAPRTEAAADATRVVEPPK